MTKKESDTSMQVAEPVPFPVLITYGYTKIIELREDLWEITDDRGDSVYATHCQLTSCGQPMFSLHPREFYVCRECVQAAGKIRRRDRRKTR